MRNPGFATKSVCHFCAYDLQEADVIAWHDQSKNGFAGYPSKTVVPVFRCPRCSLITTETDASVSQLRDFFASEYHNVRYRMNLGEHLTGIITKDRFRVSPKVRLLQRFGLAKLLARRRNLVLYELLKRLPATCKPKLLDVGFGTGLLTTRLIMIGYDAYGIDLNPEIVDYFNNFREDRFFCSTIENLSVLDESFAAILFIGSLAFVQDIKKALEKVDGLLQAGGLLLVDDTNPHNTSDSYRQLMEASYTHYHFPLEFYKYFETHSGYTIEAVYRHTGDRRNYSKNQPRRRGTGDWGAPDEDDPRLVSQFVVLRKN